MLQITPWERSALQLLASGTTLNQIGGRLGMTEREVEHRLAELFAKMGARNTTDAIASAARRGLLRD